MSPNVAIETIREAFAESGSNLLGQLARLEKAIPNCTREKSPGYMAELEELLARLSEDVTGLQEAFELLDEHLVASGDLPRDWSSAKPAR